MVSSSSQSNGINNSCKGLELEPILQKRTSKISTESKVEILIDSVKKIPYTPKSKFKSFIYQTKSRSCCDFLPRLNFIPACLNAIKRTIFCDSEEKENNQQTLNIDRSRISDEEQAKVNHDLYLAIFNGSFKDAHRSLLQGADPNFLFDKSNIKTSVLSFAIHKKREDIAALLVNNGARILDEKGVNNAIYAARKGYFELAQMMYEKDPVLREYEHFIKMIVHRFAIKKPSLSAFSGYRIEVTTLEMLNSFINFLNEESSINARLIDRKKIARSIEQALTTDSAYSQVNRGEIVSLYLLLPGHGVSGVIFKAGTDYFFVKGDRGKFTITDPNGELAYRNKSGIEFYKITKPENIDNAIKILRQVGKGSIKIPLKLHQEIGLEYYPNEIEYVFLQKKQSTGNCAWACAKLLMEIVTYANLRQRGLQHSEALQIANALYKDFTFFDRDEAVDDFLNFLSENKSNLSDEKLCSFGLPTIREILEDLVKDLSIPKHSNIEKRIISFCRSYSN